VEADCRAESAQLPEKEPLSVEVWQRVCWISASPRSSAGKLRSYFAYGNYAIVLCGFPRRVPMMEPSQSRVGDHCRRR
jgi:hypothetical protein